jgi:hypothetical protein
LAKPIKKTRPSEVAELAPARAGASAGHAVELPVAVSRLTTVPKPLGDQLAAGLAKYFKNTADATPEELMRGVLRVAYEVAARAVSRPGADGRSDAQRVILAAFEELRTSFTRRENEYRDRKRWVDRAQLNLHDFLYEVYHDEMHNHTLNLAWLRQHDPSLYQALRRSEKKKRDKTPGELDFVETRSQRLDKELKAFSVSEYARAHKLYMRQLRRKKSAR